MFSSWLTGSQPVTWKSFNLLLQEAEGLATTWAPGLQPPKGADDVIIISTAQFWKGEDSCLVSSRHAQDRENSHGTKRSGDLQNIERKVLLPASHLLFPPKR